MKLKLPLFPSLLLNLHRVNCMRPRNELTTTAAAAVLQQNPGCALVSSTLFACESISPGFTSLLPSAQAHCLCYSSSTWIPTVFDKAVQTCANFASTAVPDAYPAFVNLEGFCGNIGNIGNTKTSGSGPATTYSSTTSKSLAPTIIVSADPACYTALSLIQLCVDLIPGFMTFGPTQQASCLCYASVTSWVPKSFDNAVETCSQYAHSVSAFAGLVSSVDMFGGICERVGDLLTVGGMTSATTISNPITSPSTNTALSTTTISPSPASLPMTTSSVVSTTITRSSNQNTRSIVKTFSVITTSRLVGTTSTGGFGGMGAGHADSDKKLRDVSDPMIVLISFVCAALVFFYASSCLEQENRRGLERDESSKNAEGNDMSCAWVKKLKWNGREVEW